MQVQPETVVACARSWIGTRFHHQGRVKKTAAHGGGVDCLGLLVGVSRELGLGLEAFDEQDYPHYPDVQKLYNVLSGIMHTIPLPEYRPGDILLLNIDGNPQHLAIATDVGIIHAYAPARGVVEHVLDDYWQARIVGVFRLT